MVHNSTLLNEQQITFLNHAGTDKDGAVFPSPSESSEGSPLATDPAWTPG